MWACPSALETRKLWLPQVRVRTLFFRVRACTGEVRAVCFEVIGGEQMTRSHYAPSVRTFVSGENVHSPSFYHWSLSKRSSLNCCR